MDSVFRLLHIPWFVINNRHTVLRLLQIPRFMINKRHSWAEIELFELHHFHTLLHASFVACCLISSYVG
jgi:hypothetical protein